ncbi:HET-domain-containing protein [Didymella exigua CBS 183.55]|uniref:HET-domain-containing protein n=1 Tax=Didymella exigua CBS 183.55 TaxID=1150837 RepID=A0A6A5R611_9PLEO|nr:HET-domain-containing protein [Didymella exigua CBS 183.55]KAF1922454.1 HET-domain-containing protein [Didymella exigua CBS 183.55]
MSEPQGLDSFYTHDPLNHNDYIRLIRVPPKETTRDAATQIAVDIQTVPFQHAPPYTALSYVWGPPEIYKTISILGRQFSVRVNLWDFLDCVQQSESLNYIWVDALCIDQSCTTERNHQVALMGQIYSRASVIVAWLGAGPSELVQAFGELALMRPAETVEQFDCNRALIRRFGPTFRECNYWRRAWVVQEYVLAQHVEFWCGQERMEVGTQELCARMLWNTVFDSDTGIHDLVRLRQARQCEQDAPKDMYELLSSLSMHLRKCADTRRAAQK